MGWPGFSTPPSAFRDPQVRIELEHLYAQLQGFLSSAGFSANGAINPAIVAVVPVGAMIDFAGTTAPTGFLLCNFAQYSRTTYANLFSVIGVSWGAGNGTTTFNVPMGGPTLYIKY